MKTRFALCLSFTLIAFAAKAGPAEDCNQVGDLDLRIRGCTQYIQQSKDPKQAGQAYLQRGEGYYLKQDYDRAISDFTNAITRGVVEAYFKRGSAYGSKNDYDRAVADYTSAISANARNSDAYGNRGNVYYNKNDYDRAIADYTKFIELKPNDATGYGNRGDAYFNKKEFDRAIADYTNAIGRNANNADIYVNRARALSGKKEFDRAISDYTKAIELKPNQGFSYAGRGDIYFDKSEYRLAAADYAKAIPLLPAGSRGRTIRLRWIADLSAKQVVAALGDLLTLAKDYPTSLTSNDSSRVYRTLREAAGEKRDAEIVETIRALKRADYRGTDPRQLYDGLDDALIDPLARLGRSDDLAGVIPELRRYETFLRLKVDSRYADVRSRPALAALLQPQDFAARHLAAAQKAAARYPKYLDTQSGLIRALQLNGRYAEAVSLGQSVLSNLSSYEKNLEDEAWLRNALADALVAQGKFDAASQVLQPLILLDVKANNFVVSQLINFGGMLLWQGRYQDAIDMARKAKGASSVYGEMWIKSIEICSLARLGKAPEAEPILTELLKTADTNYRAAFRSLVCLDLTDRAAATMITMLQTESDRSTALLDLQDCKENPDRPALMRRQREAAQKIRDRSDVRKALEAVGVIISEPVACGDRYGNV